MTDSSTLAGWVNATLLLSLRVMPVFAFAPPFTLVRLPLLFKLLLGLGLSACILSSIPGAAAIGSLGAGALLVAGMAELLLGMMFLISFQLAFAALQVAGRTVDIQAGFGLALFIDPTTKAGMPLVGTLFAFTAGMVFFALDGHLELLHLLASSLQSIPIGTYTLAGSLQPLLSFISAIFLAAFGVAGAAIVTLFLADIAIAMLSRTIPQMNVLILGFQVKTIILLLVLPVSFGAAGALLARMMRILLESLPGLV